MAQAYDRDATAINLTAFRRIDDRIALLTIACDYAVVFAAAYLASRIDRLPVTLLALVVIAGRQSALQGLVHSACHYSLFRRRKRNETLEFLFAYPILDSVRLYRAQHLEHHRDFERKSPDRFEYIHDTLEVATPGRWSRTWVVFIRPLLGYAGWMFVSDQIATLRENRDHARKLTGFWFPLLAGAWLTGTLAHVALFWIVPLVWLYPVFDIWAELSDHFEANGESRNQAGVFYGLFLKGHEAYHAVHHRHPAVPFYRLRDLHDRLAGQGVAMELSRGPIDFLRIVYRSTGTSIRSGT